MATTTVVATSVTSTRNSINPKTKTTDRRGQVRRAQAKHRRRKADYQRHLEEEATRSRKLEAEAQAEETSLRKENSQLKSVLSSAAISPPGSKVQPCLVGQKPAVAQVSPQLSVRQSPSAPDTSSSLQHSRSSTTSLVSIRHDSSINAACLHTHPISTLPRTPDPSSIRNHVSAQLPLRPEDVALNFILALEHPCLTHFSHSTFSTCPEDIRLPSSGHILMASTSLYHTCPPSAFTSSLSSCPDIRHSLSPRRGSLSSSTSKSSITSKSSHASKPTWTTCSPSIYDLYALSESLDLSMEIGEIDEITPVQAWFELLRKVDRGEIGWERLWGGLERVKEGLRGSVRCFGFGATVNTGVWEGVVERVFG